MKVPEYKIDVAKVGFIYRGAKKSNSLTITIWEVKKAKVFKDSVFKWVKGNMSIRPNR